MKKILCLILTAVLLLSLCSCSIGNSLEITTGVLSEADCFDPLLADCDAEYLCAANCFEGLVRFDLLGTIEPAGCTAYSVSADGLTYTFKLNPDACYDIGDSVKTTLSMNGLKKFDRHITADDYVTACKRAILNGCDFLKNLKGASEIASGKEIGGESFGAYAEDEETLRLTLKSPDPDFLYELAALPLIPCRNEFAEALGGVYASTPAMVLTNGAYKIAAIDNKNIILEKSKSYKGKLDVKNKRITLYFTGTKKLYKDRFNNDSFNVFSADGMTHLSKGECFMSRTQTVWGLCFNFNSDIMKNADLRKAVLLATQLSNFKTPSFASGAAPRIIPADFLVHENKYDIRDAVVDTSFTDIEAAAKHLEKALDELDADTVTVKIAVPDPMLSSVKKELEDRTSLLGEDMILELTGFDENDAAKISEKGDYDAAVLPLFPERATAFSLMSSVTEAPCSCADKNFKKLLSAAEKEKDTEKAVEAFDIAEKYLIDNALFIPLFTTSTKLYLNNGITGIYCADFNRLIYFEAGTEKE